MKALRDLLPRWEEVIVITAYRVSLPGFLCPAQTF
jgi:hypothetical protein